MAKTLRFTGKSEDEIEVTMDGKILMTIESGEEEKVVLKDIDPEKVEVQMKRDPDFILSRLYHDGGMLTGVSDRAKVWIEENYPQTPQPKDGKTLLMQYAEGVRGVEFEDHQKAIDYLTELGFTCDYIDRSSR